MSNYQRAVHELAELIRCCPSSNIRRFLDESRVIVPIAEPLNILCNGADDTHRIDMKAVYWHDCIRLLDPQRDYYAILSMIDNAVGYFPNMAWLRVFRARALWETEEYRRAEADLLFALEKQGDYPLAATMLARTYLRIGRYKEAANMATAAVQMSPEYLQGYKTRILACREITHHSADELEQKAYSAIMLRDIRRITALFPHLALNFVEDEMAAQNILLQ